MLTDIEVAGTGIAGLATALALHHEGLPCRLTGADPGADAGNPWLLIPPNGTRVLRALGLLETLTEQADGADAAGQPDSIQVRAHRSGYVLLFQPLGNFAAERHGAPWLGLWRQDLLAVLANACTDAGIAGGTGTINAQPGDQPQATAADPDSRVRIIATGATRPSTEPAPLQTWQASVDLTTVDHRHAQTLANDALNKWWGPELWLQLCRTAEPGQLTLRAVASGPAPLDPDRLGQLLTGWHPGLAALVQAAGAGQTGQCPAGATGALEQFHGAGELRVGSACHGLPGNSDQHVALALEDAWASARLLDDHSDAPAYALAEYSRVRRPRRLRAAAAAGRQWREATVQGGMARFLTNTRTSLASRYLPEVVMQQSDWLYSHDVLRQFA